WHGRSRGRSTASIPASRWSRPGSPACRRRRAGRWRRGSRWSGPRGRLRTGSGGGGARRGTARGRDPAGWAAAGAPRAGLGAAGRGLEDGDPEKYLEAAEGYVAAMFAGQRAGLRPIYDALIRIGRALGGDVKICPCKTIVPLYRRHVFAEIKPATNSRIDLG